MKQGQKLKHLRNGEIYIVMNVLKNNRYLIESHKDCVILSEDAIPLNFSKV